MSDETQNVNDSETVSETPPPKKAGILKKIGVGGLVIVWFGVLLIPLFLFLLAVQGEIAVWHGSGFPDTEQHPIVQIKLIMEPRTRGLSITRSSAVDESETAVCVQTHVSYVLWQGEGEASSYCDCYQRADKSAVWVYDSTQTGQCR